MLKLKTTVIATGLSLLLMTSSAQANLSGALDGMLMNVTNPMAYESQSRAGFIGGSLQVRSPIRNVNLVAFDPPRYNAGCGGIDLFGGSFSFVNSADLVNLFRRIAQNAVGAIFMRALGAIDPKLKAIISEIQSKLQSLNQLNANTCAIAKKAVDTVWDSTDIAATVAESAATSRGAIKGFWDDLFASSEGVKAAPNVEIGKTCADGGLSICGNVMWDLMSDNRVGGVLGGGHWAGLSEKYAAELIISMIGTAIFDPDSAAGSDPAAMVLRPGLIDLSDLKTGRSTGAQKTKYVCTSAPSRGGCRDMDELPWDWEGVLGYTNQMLFGSSDGASITADSIVGKFGTLCSGSCSPTAAQQAFINGTSVPFFSMMIDVQSQPGAVQSIAGLVAPLISDAIHIQLSEAVLRAARQSIATSGGTQVPDHVHERISLLTQEYGLLIATKERNIEEIMAVSAYVKQLAMSNPMALQFVNAR